MCRIICWPDVLEAFSLNVELIACWRWLHIYCTDMAVSSFSSNSQLESYNCIPLFGALDTGLLGQNTTRYYCVII